MTSNPSDNGATLSIRELRKVYGGDLVANDGITLEIRPGEVYGLLGPNGAGKTTLVKQCIGLLKPTAGTIHLGEIDLVEHPTLARQYCSHLPQSQVPIDPLPIRQAIELVGRIRGAAKAAARKRTEELLSTLEITEWQHALGHRVSGGVRRLAGFCMAAVWPGRVMILDEPTNDIDPLRRRLLWQEIGKIAAQGTAVLLVTHNVLEAERAVDRLAIIDRARIVAEGTPASFKAGHRGQLRLQLTLEPQAEPVTPPPFTKQQTCAGRRMLLAIDESAAMEGIKWAQGLVHSGIAEEYQLAPPTLEDCYVEMVGREDALQEREERKIG